MLSGMMKADMDYLDIAVPCALAALRRACTAHSHVAQPGPRPSLVPNSDSKGMG